MLIQTDLTSLKALTGMVPGSLIGCQRPGQCRDVADRDVADRDVADRDVADRDVADRDVAYRDVADRDVADRSRLSCT